MTEAQARAHAAVRAAVAAGEITRQPCEVCGKPKTQAHHDDYAKPLDVRWLCVSCHRKWHYRHEPINKGTERPQQRPKTPWRWERFNDLKL